MRHILNSFLNGVYLVNLFVDGAGRRFEANGCWQWFLSLRSLASGLEKFKNHSLQGSRWINTLNSLYMIRKLNPIIVFSFIQNTSNNKHICQCFIIFRMLILAVLLFINLLLGKPGSSLFLFKWVARLLCIKLIDKLYIEITGAETRDLRSDEVRLMHVRRKSWGHKWCI